MKKFSKILIMILSLALLIGSVVAVGASANEGATVEIKAKNIAYTDNVTMLFAVDAELDDAVAGNVKVAYYWEEDGVAVLKEAKLLYPYDENGKPISQYVLTENVAGEDVYYPVFYTEGVPAKELGREVKIVAYTGTLPEDAEFETYSVAEYLYARLYKDGVAGATEGKDVYRKAVYENLLAYAASAQELLVNYDSAEKAVLVTDYTYVVALGAGATVNGAQTALFQAGEAEITLAYTGELTGNQELIGWTVTDAEGNSVDYTSNTITVSGAVTVAPKFGEHECVDVNPADHICDLCLEKCSDCSDTIDGDHKCDLCGNVIEGCGDANTDGKCDECGVYTFSVDRMESGDALNIYNVTMTNSSSFDERNYIDNSTDRAHSKAAFLSLADADPKNAANRVLKISSATVGSAKLSTITFTPDEWVSNGTVYVLEADLAMLGDCTNNGRPYIEAVITDDEGAIIKYMTALYSGTKENSYVKDFKLAGVSSTDSKHYLNVGEWGKVRYIFSNGNFKSFYSLDGGETWVEGLSNTYSGTISQLGFRFNVYNCNGTTLVDNVSVYKTDAVTMNVGGSVINPFAE